jgi:hypothetical protein
MKQWNKKILLLSVVILLNGLFFYSVKAATDNSNITVQVTVPSSGDGGSGGGGGGSVPDTTQPTITGVASSTTQTTASVTWTASDNVAIQSVSFGYGKDLSYGTIGVVVGNNNVSLSTLDGNTLYNYKITAIDSSGNSAIFTGSFKTLDIGVVLDVVKPIISAISSSTSYTTASISWKTTDDKGLSSVTLGYGSPLVMAVPTAQGENYSVNLSGLSTSTIYTFIISASDTSGNSVSSTGSFKTATEVQAVSGPTIINVVVTPGISSAVVTIKTDKNTTAQINFGKVSLDGSVIGGLVPSSDYSVTIPSLSPNTLYNFQVIATYLGLYSTSTAILQFNTLPNTNVPDVSNFAITPTVDSLILTWKNPSLNFNPDFEKVRILRRINNPVVGPNDVGKIYEGDLETFTDNSALTGFVYYYTIFSANTSQYFSNGVTRTSTITVVPTEICNDNIDNNNDSRIDCADPTCVSDVYCKKTDVPTTTIPTETVPVCGDGKDNDGDGLIDFPADNGCTGAQDTDEYSPPTATVPEFEKLTLDKLKFFSGSRQIELFVKDQTVSGLAGSNLSVGIKKSSLIGEPKSLILRVGDTDQYKFELDVNNNTYYADILFPQNGTSQAFVEINYGADQFDSIGINFQAVNLGQVTGDKNSSLAGVEVRLHKENGDSFLASIFGQKNPQITNGDALIGWMVPNGRYYITATKDGFYEYSGQFFNVNNSIINTSISLLSIPPKILDVIDPNASVAKNIGNVAKNIAQKTSVVTALAVKQVEDATTVVQEIAANPEVKQVANTVVAPTAVGVAAVGTVALISWVDILPLLRFLFIQPILMLGRGKREKWGTVYNSLSKLPVDLALVRLFNIDTGKLVQTKVTGSDGRYFFTTDVGRYRMEVRKGAFEFPSSLLKGFQVDGNRVDVYHGEEVDVTNQGSVITANIPLDPAGQKLKTPFRLIFSKMVLRIQNAISWVGLVVTVGVLYISPVWYMWLLLGVHLALMFAFRRLAKPTTNKGWGIVYDEQTKKPLSKVVARLFDSKFNKLVATEITGPDGKYYFMAGDNQYYVAYDRDGYNSLKTDIVDLKGKESETIAKDVNLKKK